jgi:hypothetical protein
MINFRVIGVAAVLTAAFAGPVFAQAAIDEPGMYAFYHPNADVLHAGSGAPTGGMASAGTGKAYAMASTRHYTRKHIAHIQGTSVK